MTVAFNGAEFNPVPRSQVPHSPLLCQNDWAASCDEEGIFDDAKLFCFSHKETLLKGLRDYKGGMI